MSIDALHCERHPRRERIRGEGWNGLDELEVSDDQRVLTVTFLAKAPDQIDEGNVRIDAPPGARKVRVKAVQLCREDDPDRDDCMRVVVDRPGDFSTYTLRVVQAGAHGRPGQTPLEGFDPRYASIGFSFKAGCPSDEDCAREGECPPERMPEPAISYLAKDYESFRQLILDRLALIMPGWRERHVPDLAITLVELLAYVGDNLSYYQDAVGTEAYLDTARRRVSVRRHVRLVDYRMHEGCNARAWVCVEVSEDVTLDPAEICFVTTATAGGPVVAWETVEAHVRGDELRAYELVDDAPVALRVAHNRIELWTWGDSECCLTRGATRATLKDSYLDPEQEHYDHSEHEAARAAQYESPSKAPRRRALDWLRAGDVLIFEEVIGPATGNPADADPRHRQAVRLTSLTRTVDELYGQPVVEVEWEPDDALSFAMCLSTIAGEDCLPIANVSVARGNVVLVDHGVSVTRCGAEAQPLEPREERRRTPACDGPCDPGEPVVTPAPYTPGLVRGPVTQRTTLPDPRAIGARQAQRLARIPRRVRARLDALIDDARAGETLSREDLEWLVLLFGAHAVREAGFAYPRPRPRRGQGAGVELDALKRLSARETSLLQCKVRRTNTLARHARAGKPLTDSEREELSEMWGSHAADWADPPGQALWGPAADALAQDPRAALAALWVDELTDDGPPRRWSVRPDLLGSGPADRHLVVEVDDEGMAHLRFGDGKLGRAPAPGARLEAFYRVGNGTAGNVAAETITVLASCTDAPLPVTRVRNALPAMGGSDAEPVDEVRLIAPDAFRAVPLRAITAEDYAALADVVPGVQRGVARLRWTGSWYESLVGVDAVGTGEPSPALLETITLKLEHRRRVGHGLRVEAAHQVALDLALEVCVAPAFQRGHVLHAVRAELGSAELPGGRRGMFHPDELTFGSTIAVSAIIARVRAIPGVETARVTTLRRLLGPSDSPPVGSPPEPPPPVFRLGPLEVAVLDADPGAPNRGRLTLNLRGGR